MISAALAKPESNLPIILKEVFRAVNQALLTGFERVSSIDFDLCLSSGFWDFDGKVFKRGRSHFPLSILTESVGFGGKAEKICVELFILIEILISRDTVSARREAGKSDFK